MSSPASLLEGHAANELTPQSLQLGLHNLQIGLALGAPELNQRLRRLIKDCENGVEAFRLYEKAKSDVGFVPDSVTVRLLARCLLRFKQWGEIADLAEDFRRFRVFPDRTTCVRLVGRCIRSRKFKVSEVLLGVLATEKEIAVAVFESAMISYNKLHMYRNSILFYDKMKLMGVLPDSRCYYQIMEACRKVGDADKVLAIFSEFESRKLNDGRLMMDKIYWSLCDSLCKSGRPLEALDFFRSMVSKGIPLDSSFYSSLICSFAGLREVSKAEELFKEGKERGMVKDPVIFLKMILMYVEEGLVEKCLGMAIEMESMEISVSDCIICAVVNGYAKKRGANAAVEVYEEMIALGFEPGQVTYASAINFYNKLGLSSMAEKVFHEMEQKGFHKCVVAYATMVSIYGKSERIRDAMRLVAKMKERGCEPNVWVYNSLIDMHGRALNIRQVEKLWKEMKRRKIAPDKVTYTSVITAYSKAKEFEDCIRFYKEFRMNGGQIDRTMAGIMVSVYSKSSRIDELVRLLHDIKSEGTGLDGRLYRSALNALRDSGLQVHVRWFEESFGIVKTRKLMTNTEATSPT